ncbi:MAG TPA: primosomal replication protein N [Burkholderiales bacterium]|nr:primosomal replication protein N [Burkholderiales bacterium]
MTDTGNRFVVQGRLAERDALRHTPAGVPILNFRIAHASQQMEAGAARQVEFELACVAVEEKAKLLSAAALGSAMLLSGFMALGTRSGRQLVLHVDKIEFRSDQ